MAITEAEYTSKDAESQSEDLDFFDDVFMYIADQIDSATYQGGITLGDYVDDLYIHNSLRE